MAARVVVSVATDPGLAAGIPSAFDEEQHRTVLPNGLTVLSERVPGVRTVSLGAWVRAASVHETADMLGAFHMLEHLAFKGTVGRSAREIAASIEQLGGSLDASTGRENTFYQATVLGDYLETAADVLADMIFSPALRAEDLKLERNVILEEINMVDDSPDDLIFELHGTELWGDQPWGRPILGTRETVAGMTVERLRELHAGAYHPANIVLAAAGNVNHAELLAVLERTGWSADRGVARPFVAPPRPSQLAPVRRHFRRSLAQAHSVIGTGVVGYSDRRHVHLALADLLLGGGMSAPLFQRVREDLGLAYSVHSFQSVDSSAGVQGVYLATSHENADQAIGVVLDLYGELAVTGFSDRDFATGVRQMKGQIAMAMESVGYRVMRLGIAELYGLEVRTYERMMAELDAVSVPDIQAVCTEFLDPARQTIVTLGAPDGAREE